MAITPDDKKISQMAEVAPSAGMFVPLVDLTQLPASQNVRASVGSILALVDLTGYVPTSRTVNTSGSLTGGGDLSANRTLSLSGDSASPGNSQYYGTNGAGTKGFFPLPSAGTGTVTSFSSGNLSPLFTTSVATATTTPALSFALSTQSANLVFAGPTNGAAAAPTFRSLVAADIPSLSGVYQPLNANLTAISALTTTSYGLGFLELANAAAARTYIGAGTGTGTVTSVGLTMPSGFSVGGSPVTTTGTLAVTTTLSGIVVGDGTGLIARTATGTTDRISITNGSGVAGNPTFDIAATYAGQASITTLGTIATGTWQATTLARNYGGTGFTSYAEGDLLYGNAGSGLSKLAIQTLPGYFLLSGSTPSWAQLSSSVVTSINGTANEITASASTGSVTLSLPSALTFTGKTITGGTYSSGAFNGTVGATTPGTIAATTIATNSLVTISNGSGGEMLRLNVAGNFVTGGPAFVTFNDGSSHSSYLGHGGVANAFDISTSISGGVIRFLPSSGTLAGTVTSTGFQGAIGATTPSTGAFTTINAFSTLAVGVASTANAIIYFGGSTAAYPALRYQDATTIGLVLADQSAFADLVADKGRFISGIDGTPIGATTPSTGAFTTLASTTGASDNGMSIRADAGFGAYTAYQAGASFKWAVGRGPSTGGNEFGFFSFDTGTVVATVTTTGLNATAIGATTPSTGAFTSIINGSTTLLQTSVALTNGAAASAGTLLNAPAAGNPTKWIPINDNGTTRYVPAW